ncbi:hypothetical protein FCL40_05535 [Ferrimonas sediminicola]|uniref:Lipoprotein n=1 Tax=Ferrimonas sediminicola TaxID=2569538 RepID=A0A4V5NXZ4_9GAMM|nr:DUF6279 family lipoprotein [Ferrimonas sediminicola]TKB50613.1 hypothetical protein FCL40_05535 [Ferrimonas sediminicola]
MKGRWVLVMVLALVLTGCSTKFVYNWLDWIIEWEVADYVDLSRSQETQFEDMVDEMLAWHRREELPRYRHQLLTLRHQINHQLTSEDALAHIGRLEQHWLRIFDHLMPRLVPLMQTLTDEQVEQLLANIRRENQKDLDRYLNKDFDQRVARANKRTAKSLKRWVGKLTPLQRQAVDDFNHERHQSMDLWVAYRQAWQERFGEALRNRSDGQRLQSELRLLLVTPDKIRPAGYRAQLTINQHNFADALESINASLTGKQRKRLNRELGSLIDDLADLSKN